MTTQPNPLHMILLPELQAELDKTRRTLERVPEGHNDFRPHERSKTLLELANHLATVAGLAGSILTSATSIELGGPTDPRRFVKEESPAAILPIFNELAANSVASLQAATDEALAEPWQASQQGKVMFSGTRYAAYRNIGVNHIIHHRAQLGVYLRLLNVPVPYSFGPSADESLS